MFAWAGTRGSAVRLATSQRHHTGTDSLYVATPDRGPADGTTTYVDRIYTIRLAITKGHHSFTITPTLLATRLMHDGRDFLTGFAAAFDATNSPDSLRFDPEGIRVDRCGQTVFVSDEYGPFIHVFDLDRARAFAPSSCRTS